MVDLLIVNARVVGRASVSDPTAIAVRDGRIAAVGDDAADPGATPGADDPDERIDAEGAVALPGVVDVHNHLHDPGLFDGFDFATGTASAVAGGVTTVVELPTQTPVADPEAFEQKRRDCEDLAHVDFGLVAGNVEDPEVDVEGVMAAGTPDFKCFLSEPYRIDDRGLVTVMDRVGDAGGRVRVHCETQGVLDHAREAVGDDPEAYVGYHEARPLAAELDAIARAGRFAEYADCPLHVVHVSSGTGAREAARVQARREVPVTIETCPHYLAFDRSDAADRGPFLTVNPSLKSRPEVEGLWRAVADGTVDLVASEHFPTHREERARGWENVWEPYAGLPGIETTLEYVASEGVHDGPIDWPRLRELLCDEPARVSGIYPRKGTLRPGTDADVVLVDREEHVVDADDLAFGGGWTPYEGQEWTARVRTTVAGGEVAARDHEVLADPGNGEFLPRGPLATGR